MTDIVGIDNYKSQSNEGSSNYDEEERCGTRQLTVVVVSGGGRGLDFAIQKCRVFSTITFDLSLISTSFFKPRRKSLHGTQADTSSKISIVSVISHQ